MSYTFWQQLEHRQDSKKYVGYDFRGNIFRNVLSNVFFNDNKRTAILLYLDDVYSYLIDSIKMIKKARNYALPKYYRDFN
jgi:hypothetical protein